jgi:hypothetical protein
MIAATKQLMVTRYRIYSFSKTFRVFGVIAVAKLQERKARLVDGVIYQYRN